MTQAAENTDQPMANLNGKRGKNDAPMSEKVSAEAQKIRESAQQAIGEGVEAASTQLQTASQDLSSAIKRNPTAAIGVALGAGLLLGLALRGRK